jgi:hypothetical protein
VLHIFPFGTVLEAGCAVVVFGGGSLDALGGSSLYQTASSGSLQLNNNSETITIFDDAFPDANPIASITYGAEGGNDQSLTRDPDLSGPFVGHNGVANSIGSASPGTKADGSEFCPAVGDLSISLSAPTMIESGGSIIATITRTGSTAEELEIAVKIDDATEAETDLFIPDLEYIPAGQASVQVTINAIDDIALDGPQTVKITARAARYNLGVATFTVLDDGDSAFDDLVINEFLHDPPLGAAGDANGDGTRDGAQDEFVELLNVSGAPFDLSGYLLQDSVQTRHVFPPGTILADGQAIVVFGGGFPNGNFGGSLVQTASTGMLGLNNAGDSVILALSGGNELLRVDYGDLIVAEAVTRSPDGTGEFVAHSSAGGALFSPGTKTDGALFPGGSSGPSFSITSIKVNVSAATVTVRVRGLQPDVTYDFESSTDLNNHDLFGFIHLFTTDDGTEVSPGVYEFTFADASISTAATRFYRIALF